MHEPEPDAAPWSFLNIDSIFSNNYYGDGTQHDVKISHEQYIRDVQCANTDNDEIVAHSLLHEELSQLSIEEHPELSHSGEEYLQDSTVAPDWHNSSNNYYTGPGADREGSAYESDDAGSPCSSPGDRSCEGDDYSCILEITDESELDGEVEKRLHQMIPVPVSISSMKFIEFDSLGSHNTVHDSLINIFTPRRYLVTASNFIFPHANLVA